MSKIKLALMNHKLLSGLVIVALIAAVALILQFALTANNTNSTKSDSDLAATSTEGHDKPIAMVRGPVARVEFDDLVAQSSLVVRGRASANYEELLILAVESTGDPVCFTDRYFEVLEVYRGELNDDTIAIRTLGGNKGAGDVSMWVGLEEPSFVAGEEYLLYLHKPNYGGGWETEGEYYRVVGVDQGIFTLEEDGLYHSIAYNETLTPETFAQDMAAINQNVPVDYDYYRNFFMNALETNFENGFIAEEQYLNELRIFDVYGTIVG